MKVEDMSEQVIDELSREAEAGYDLNLARGQWGSGVLLAGLSQPVRSLIVQEIAKHPEKSIQQVIEDALTAQLLPVSG